MKALYRLGDAVTDLSATLSTSQAQSQATLAQTNLALSLNAQVRPSPFTDYSGGMLSGWWRVFSPDGSYTTVPAPLGPGTLGPPPSAQDWQNFDNIALQLGVGGYVAGLRNSATSSSNFLDKVGTAVSTGLTQVFGKQVVTTVAQAVAVLDKTVPGWATLVDVLGPALPFIPAITAILGATAGIAPELVGAAFQTVQTTANVADTLTGLPTSQASQILRPLDTFTQNTVAQAVNYAAQVGTTNANAVAQVQASLLKAVSTAAYTRGTALQKFEAAGVEAANGVILALQVAAAVLPGGQAAGPALQALALALKATITAATASGDAGQIAEAVGFVIAKGLPAILVGVGDVALTATGVASTVVTVGGDTTVATDAATGFTTTTTIDPLFSTTLGTLVRGIASVEATAISTSASVAQVYLAAQRLKDATDAANRAAVAKAQALDAQTVALQQKLVVLQKNAPARAAASGAPASLAPLAFGALVLALIARGR